MKVALPSLQTLDLRTRSGQFFIEVRDQISRDLGDRDQLSRQQREIIDRCAGMATRLSAEDALFLSGKPSMSAGEYATLSNSLVRSLVALGLRRAPRDVTPDLQSYIASRASPAERVAA